MGGKGRVPRRYGRPGAAYWHRPVRPWQGHRTRSGASASSMPWQLPRWRCWSQVMRGSGKG